MGQPADQLSDLLPAFSDQFVPTPEATIRVRVGGSGPPLLLLHGHPQTHAMWHRVAPQLATRFTVVVTDLRGYGASSKPPTTPDHSPYSKRAMARDQLAVMEHLGFDSFGVVGHDRGARVAYRLALDAPAHVSRLTVIDIIPTLEAFQRTDMDFALANWGWFFLAQPAPLPESLIGHDPNVFYLRGDRTMFDPRAMSAYRQAFTDPATIHAMCEDYRAGTTIDLAIDAEDRGRRRITCPVLALWSAEDFLGDWCDILEIWREWADDVQGYSLPGGHFLAEEAPDELLKALIAFFG